MAVERKPAEAVSAVRAGATGASGGRGSGRVRAPKRVGKRVQLTIPDALLEAAQAIARARQTTVNDVLVLLALEGAEAYQVRQERRERAEAARRVAFRKPTGPEEGTDLSEAEILDAVMAMRRGG